MWNRIKDIVDEVTDYSGLHMTQGRVNNMKIKKEETNKIKDLITKYATLAYKAGQANGRYGWGSDEEAKCKRQAQDVLKQIEAIFE